MKKMSLNLEQLAVESFEIANERALKGTVRGHDVCSDVCTASCGGTCGILPASAESECAAFPRTRFCGGTEDLSVCQPCCV
ncbi:hypothetical protein [Longimicrobium sp.]|uniref:hypothetical protein n=1 Tax=Longimicrobium sp. TaxID=2029185 RepID=UPI002C423137|nr:hypothetical protein [Longimicrobium sp.]HSU15933.1 hypothetical protein [Longimicrobium sp.]